MTLNGFLGAKFMQVRPVIEANSDYDRLNIGAKYWPIFTFMS